MKQNEEPIAVERSDEMVDCLVKIFKDKKGPRVVIESGTFEGLGTTQVVIEAIEKSKMMPPRFYTLEPHYHYNKIARKNLENYSYIEVIRGISVGYKEALDFINNDEMLKNHEDYPDLLCDGFPVADVYLFEINAPFFENPDPPEEKMFEKLIPMYEKHYPLFVLDSAGGLGLLEFMKVNELMGNRDYWLMTDDINHLKHYRSYLHVKKAKEWDLLFENGRQMIARRKKT